MRILSLFDGMSCGYIAMMLEDIPIDRYVAYEIDKYAIQTATHNFPDIEERGDVFEADFTEFKGFDWLVGGSPCTYWSIAQKNNRETEASGLGWELFCQYARALREAKPKWFIYENNKSMSKEIRESITEAFGFEPICINSALVSAQNRQRLYWVGRRNEDGTYSKVDVPMPEDRGILLKDILEDGCVVPKDKAYCLKHQAGNARDYFKKHHTDVKFEAVALNSTDEGDKARTLMAGYYKYGTATLITNKGFKGGTTAVATPVNITADGKAQCIRATCYKDGIRNLVGNDIDKRTAVAEPVDSKTVEMAILKIVDKYGYLPEMFNAYNRAEIIDKAPTLSTGSMVTSSCAVNKFERMYGYATPTEWDEDGRPIKAVSCADGKVYTVYEVKDGKITIKDKEYPIKLVDGFYIIRKLTVRECMRLQTVPEWYEFPVSDSQAYKLLGNGWTIEVIRGLIRAVKKEGGKG